MALKVKDPDHLAEVEARWAGIVKQLLDQIQDLTVRAEAERRSLLDRIQHPQKQQVEPVEGFEHDEPADTLEYSLIGQEVPEDVRVHTYTPEDLAQPGDIIESGV
jgi:hypothetical protein